MNYLPESTLTQKLRDLKCAECGNPALTYYPKRDGTLVGACGKHPDITTQGMRAANQHRVAKMERKSDEARRHRATETDALPRAYKNAGALKTA